jgi:hypothetical protein
VFVFVVRWYVFLGSLFLLISFDFLNSIARLHFRIHWTRCVSRQWITRSSSVSHYWGSLFDSGSVSFRHFVPSVAWSSRFHVQHDSIVPKLRAVLAALGLMSIKFIYSSSCPFATIKLIRSSM